MNFVLRNPMNRYQTHFINCSLVALTIVCWSSSVALAQDSVQVKRGEGARNASGKIASVTPFGVNIEASDGMRTVPAAQISKISYQGQPLEIERARTQIGNGRYEGAIEELQKINDSPKRPEIKQEIDFLIAKSNAEIAFQGGGVTSTDAGRGLVEFLRAHPESIHFYPATELLGRLLFAVGKFDLAEKEFQKLNDSQWQEYILKGNFGRGESLMEQGKAAEAAQAYTAILNDPANDDLTQAYKLIAKARLAKSEALLGRPDAAITAIEGIIKVEDSTNAFVFSYLYNSLGSIYLQQDKLKEARSAFLVTQLLYTTERDPHAEAVYHLTLIWPKLNQGERANSARSILRDRHRNTVWAMKLQ